MAVSENYVLKDLLIESNYEQMPIKEESSESPYEAFDSPTGDYKRACLLGTTKIPKASSSQCRMCLRKVPVEYLAPLDGTCLSNFESFFACVIDATNQFVCDNCTNLMDILVNFKQAVLDANRILEYGSFTLQGSFWQDPDNVEAVAKSRIMVEYHLQELNSMVECSVENVDDEEKMEMFRGFDDTHLIAKKSDSDSSEEMIYRHYDDSEDIQLEDSNMIPGPPDEEIEIEFEEIPIETKPSIKPTSSKTSVASKKRKPHRKGTSEQTSLEKPTIESKSSRNESSNKAKKSHKKATDGMIINTKKKKIRKPLTYNQTHVLCDFCGKTIHIMTREHHLNEHKGIQPYRCEKGCDRRFYGVLHKQRHEHRMHGGSDGGAKTQECDICGKVIRGCVNDLNLHKKVHEGKEFRCETCGKTYTQRRFLLRHRIVHLDVYRYECNYCSKKFKYKASLKGHEKSVHEKKSVLSQKM
ncbi:zinc finger protein 2-like [Uranotaenia lowii]|uniref:zinc finger protein 2-like n=1 Tax=Uranotaenia lowii TaxID=190385 RepID=UPI00247A8007|nr:zinc finger protein 2-like [Uranotaenia lowii]